MTAWENLGFNMAHCASRDQDEFDTALQCALKSQHSTVEVTDLGLARVPAPGALASDGGSGVPAALQQA
ncbi:hypothetical protein [Microbacterium sp. KNMS]